MAGHFGGTDRIRREAHKKLCKVVVHNVRERRKNGQHKVDKEEIYTGQVLISIKDTFIKKELNLVRKLNKGNDSNSFYIC